jgi:hypothetical protein
MKTVKKFTSFEDLKSSESKTVDAKSSLKKHNDFEKVIKDIYSVKVRSNDNKQFKWFHMEEKLKNSLLAVCRLLEKYDVQYMMIGGTAVALNGYYRHSINIAGELTDKPDIDIWYNPTYENYFNFLKAIEELGQDITEFKNEHSPDPRKSFFKLDFDEFTLDALPEIKADIKFAQSNQRKETVELEAIKIHFMNYHDLIEDKKATARKKDIEDIEQLRKIRGAE